MCLKKKIVLKTETNLHSVNQKTLKGKKKKMKRIEMNKVTYTAKKKKLYWEIWDLKLKKRYWGTSTSRRHKSYEQGGKQNIDIKCRWRCDKI